VSVGHREASVRYERRKSIESRDIGDIPWVEDQERKEQAEQSLSFFCQTYQSSIYTRPFSDVHYACINRLETAIKQGGLFAYAMPRGTGKTSLVESACLWAVLAGHRRYVVLISSTEKHASQSLGNIKLECSSNELIYADWPEVVYPIWALEGVTNRAPSQVIWDKPTYLVWKGDQLVFPTIPDSKASGSVVEVRGITSSIRGMKANLPGGQGSIRPELVVLDDPQTDESSKSPTQCNDREAIVKGTILGLAGHEHRISAVMPCTVIHKGDLAERFLDQEKEPEWNGTKTGILKTMPSDVKLWEEYSDIKRSSVEKATEFYIENREAMDKDAIPMWNECYNTQHGQLSAIQYAMDLRIRVGEQAFWAEYMNSPLDNLADGEVVTFDQIVNKTTGYQRWIVPPDTHHITGYIDVHKRALFYMVVGWDTKFNGHILQYNTWPETKRKYYTYQDLSDTLQAKYGGTGVEGAVYAGLRDLTEKILFHTWGHSGLHTEKCLIDANWKTQLIKSFCREMKWSARLLPGHGRFIGPDRKPLDEYTKNAGDIPGHYWRIPASTSKSGTRHVLYDVNYWKSFVNTSLIAPPGERGCIQLFDSKDHKIVAEHFTSEYPTEVSARGKVINQWQPYPGREDTHFWDCLVGNAVAASILGCSAIDKQVIRQRRTRVSYMVD